MIKVGINGACGKMGLRLINLLYRQPDLKLTVAMEQQNHPAMGKDIGPIAGLNLNFGVLITNQVKGQICDVILDFSSPLGTMGCIQECKKYKIALLTGTTGFTQQQINKIKEAGKSIAVLISPNFSQGATILGNLGQEVIYRLGKGVDIEIEETHHKAKRDAPSGTAIRLSQELKIAVKNKEIPIHSLRVGDVIGEHKMIFAIPGERIELTHKVDNRDAFAYGALKAARILARKSPGFYTMNKIIG